MSGEAMTAELDHGDRLRAADPAFAALNERAGGTVGASLATPQLATIVRLARRLRIPVARSVTIADGELDLDLWVRAVPGADGVALTLTVMRERDGWRAAAAEPTAVPPPAGADWTWETDAALRFTHLSAEAARMGVDGVRALGRPLTSLFALRPGEDGRMPLLEAAAARIDFDGQRASVQPGGGEATLAGLVRRDRRGEFAGFVGGTFATPAPPAGAPPAFNARLETILRGPLGRIIAHADSINAATDGPIDPHYAGYAADIASAGRHLLGLVDDLSDIEAIERPGFAIAPEPVDLADIAARAAGLLSVRAAGAGVRIDRGDLDTPLPATGEFRRVLQILVNLIGNAVRYSPRDATVWLRLQRDSDRAVVIVADQGKGIAPVDHARIFDKFGRVDPDEPGGSGLGLYIARRLARAMGGDLTVDSAPGEGARFILSLPARN